jgi:hypothetical protein
MTDREIRERRAQLEKRKHEIHEEWKEYDKKYPVEVGAYKPYDYDRQQLWFAEQLRDLSEELSKLPSTKAEKLGCLAGVLAVLGLAWVVWRYVL